MLRSFSKTVAMIGAASAAAGAAIEAGLGAAVAHFVSAGDELEKMSIRTGMSVEQLSLLKYAAGQSDASLQDIAGAARHMAMFLREANNGAKEATDTLDTLGMTFDQLRSVHPDKLFEMFAAAIGKLPLNDIERNAIAVKIFGRNALSLIPMFKELGDLIGEGQRLGQMVTAKDAHNAVELGDAWDRITKTMKMGLFEIGAALGPDLKAAADVALGIVQMGLAWVRENRELVKLVALVAGGLVGIGAAATIVAGAVALISFGISSGILPATLIVAGFWGGIAGAVYLAYKHSTRLQEAWDGLAKGFGPAWDGIVKSLKAGELSLAFQIASVQMQLVWDEKLGWLEKRFRSATTEVFNYWTDLSANIQNAWDIVLTGLGKGLSKFTDYFRAEIAALAVTFSSLIKVAAVVGGVVGSQALKDAAALAEAIAKGPAQGRAAFTLAADAIDPELAKRVAERNDAADAAKSKRIDEATVADIRQEGRGGRLRKQLDELLAQAAALKPFERNRPNPGNIEDFSQQGKIGTLGTFSGISAGLQFGSQDRMVTEQQRTNVLLKDILDRGGLTFEG